jgi:SAM-dependent methyltransferase
VSQIEFGGQQADAASAADAALLDALMHAIRSGKRPADFLFDRFLPLELRLVSGQHWTPVEVALRAAEWLEHYGVRSVLDVGAGAGKFCVVAALASNASFVGVEQRTHLVQAAQALAKKFNVAERVEFVHGEFDALARVAEAYYLFNPFGENLYGMLGRLDARVEQSGSRYRRDVTAAEHLLERSPAGTFVLTYNGFGGDVPKDYELIRVDRELPNVLGMWRKR